MKTAGCNGRTGLWLGLTLWLAGATAAPAETMTLEVRDNRLLSGPAVAFNPVDRLYLAAWEYHYGTSDWDINGRVVDANGQPVGNAFGIAWSGSIKQQETDLCYNPVTNQFLVAYSLSPGNWNVSACVVDGNGVPGPFVHIADTTFTELSPAVACDPTTGQYLVAYEREHVLDGVVWREVWAQFLLPDGTRLGDPLRLSDPAYHSHECAVAGTGGQYMVVWTEEQKGGKSIIVGRFIQGGYPSKTTFSLAKSKDSIQPQVVYNQDRAEYLVVYQDRTSSTARWALEGTRINTIGEIKGTYSIIKSLSEHCQVPAVAYDRANGQYLVTWAQGPAIPMPSIASHQIWALCLDSNGKPFGEPMPISDPGKNLPIDFGIPAPAIATGFCDETLVVWEDQSIGLSIGVGSPSTNIYSILGSYGTWCEACGDCNGVDEK